jgi:hypothetical protein
MILCRTSPTSLIYTLMISYSLGDVDGNLIVSFFIETPFMKLREALKKKGFIYHRQRTSLHTCMIHIFGNLVMIWLQICSTPLRMTCRSIRRVIFGHHLICTLLGMQICSLSNFNHCAQILIDTRSWPSRDTLRSTLPKGSTFILKFLVGIYR